MPNRKNCQLYSCDIQIIKLNIRYLEVCSTFGFSLNPEWFQKSDHCIENMLYEGFIRVIALTVLALLRVVQYVIKTNFCSESWRWYHLLCLLPNFCVVEFLLVFQWWNQVKFYQRTSRLKFIKWLNLEAWKLVVSGETMVWESKIRNEQVKSTDLKRTLFSFFFDWWR